MKKNLVGSHKFLEWMPVWGTAFILYMVTIGMIFLLRDLFEGLFYNTSYSSMLGDGALCAVVLMSAEMLKRGESPPQWTQSLKFHVGAAIVAVLFGFTWWSLDHPKQLGDIYHHLVIAPLLFYFALTLLPLILGRGTTREVVATFAMILIWASLVVYDGFSQRLHQRGYYGLDEHLKKILVEKKNRR